MKKNIAKQPLELFVEKHYGKRGTSKREKFEADYTKFKEQAAESEEVDLFVAPMPLSEEDKQRIHDAISTFKKARDGK